MPKQTVKKDVSLYEKADGTPGERQTRVLEWGVWGWGSLIKHTGKVPIFFNDR